MQQPLHEQRQAIDPRLEWVHDKEIGPDWNRRTEPLHGVAWYVRAGEVTVRTERGEWRGRPGDWVFLLPGRRYQTFLPGSRIVSICYRFGRPCGSPWYVGPDALVLRDCPELDAAAGQLIAQVEAAGGVSPIGWSFNFSCTPPQWLQIDAAFRVWLAAAFTTLSSRGVPLAVRVTEDERVARALGVIERDPWAAASEPTALADAIGLSRRRLEQLFATAIGRGIAEERDRLRLAGVQELLGRRGLQIKQIAKRFGFASGPAFSVWFHRHAGMSPRAFLDTIGLRV